MLFFIDVREPPADVRFELLWFDWGLTAGHAVGFGGGAVLDEERFFFHFAVFDVFGVGADLKIIVG